MAQAAAPELPPAVLEAIIARATAQYETWKTTTTPEEKTQLNESLANMRNQPNLKEERMAQAEEDWRNADLDNDGRLNLAEYRAWNEVQNRRKAETGFWVEPGDHTEEDYNIVNQIDETEGITQAQLWQMAGPWLQKWHALKAADGL